MLSAETPAHRWRRRALIASATAAMAVGLTALAPAAYAGDWMQVSCVNPDQSAAPSVGQGWSASALGSPQGSSADATCSPGVPMQATLSGESALAGSAEYLQYTPPSGSTLVGGSVDVSLFADGYGANAWGETALYTPAFSAGALSPCAIGPSGLSPCGGSSSEYSGTIDLPANAGGDLYISAGCGGNAGASCNEGASNGGWAVAKLYFAHLLLSNSSQPAGSDFAGALLNPNAEGSASLTFTATDPGGPGVYHVLVSIDGATVYNAAPNTNGGSCSSVGTDSSSGALMFDYQQPCLQTESVDLPIDTTQFANGQHELKVVVTDAAGNSATVLDQRITINNSPPSQLASASPATASAYTFVAGDAMSTGHHTIYRSYSRSALTLTGTLDSLSGLAAPGVTVTAWAAPPNSPAFTKVAATTTDSAGHWALYLPKGSSRLVRVVAAGGQPTSAPSTLSVTESVTPSLSLRVSARPDAKLVFTGWLTVAPLGAPRPLVSIEVHSASGWQPIGTPVRVASNGHYGYVYSGSPIVIGSRLAFRATTPPTTRWRPGFSPVRHAIVR